MKITTKQYIDGEIAWVRSLKQVENVWLEKSLEAEWRAEREARKSFNDTMNTFRRDHEEWKGRIEHLVSQTVTRREMRAMLVTVITILLTFLGLLVAIFLKK